MSVERTVSEQLAAIASADVGHRRKHVTILGAGVAGLAAAHELSELDHAVTIIEASNRLGGRAWTHRFANGDYHELGAMRIAQSHDFTRHYVLNVCGLEMRKFVNHHDQPRRSYAFRGIVAGHDEVITKLLPAFALSDKEREMCSGPAGPLGLMTPFDRLTDEIKNSPADLSALFAKGPMTPRVRELETVTLGGFLRKELDTEEAVELVGAVTGLEVWWDRAVAMLVRDSITGAGSSFDEVVGGTEMLPSTLAAKLVNRVTIELGTAIVGMHVHADGVQLVCSRGGAVFRRDVEYVLCTIPFSVLRRLEISGISKEKATAIRNLSYTTSTKVLFSCERRFWEADGIAGGGSQSDQINRQIYYPSDSYVPAPVVARSKERPFAAQYEIVSEDSGASNGGSPERSGPLVGSYCWGADASRLAALEPSARAEVVRRCVGEIHPEILEQGAVIDSASMAWEEYPWASAAFSFLRPGDMELYYASARLNEGSLYFAGEHCSMDQGWMQGAIRSGLEAVELIVART